MMGDGQETVMVSPTFFAVAIGSQLFITVAEGVPAFDAAPGQSEKLDIVHTTSSLPAGG